MSLKMSSPIISVIVPVYNAEKFLHRCIDSILVQSFTDFELLLINDGSKDSSGRICDEYATKDSRVRVFHKENGGVSSARNLGLDNAKGEWIAFVDADDYIDKDFLCNYNDRKENVDAVVQSVICIHQGHVPCTVGFEREKLFTSPLECVKHIIAINKGLLGYSVNKLYKKSIISDNKIYYDTRLKFREDEEFVLRYFSVVSRVVCVPYAGYFYIMPTGDKYLCTDVFWAVAKSYRSIKRMSRGGNALMTKFQIELTKELISSLYSSSCNDKLDRLLYFCKVVNYRMLSWGSVKTAISKCWHFIMK